MESLSDCADTAQKENRVTVHPDYYQPDGVDRFVSMGWFSFVGLMENGSTVMKYPHNRNNQEETEAIRQEAARYRKLGPHENLVEYQGLTEDGLLLGYCERGILEHVIPTLSLHEKNAMAQQVTRCLMFMHERNYIHCDLNVNNVFVTADLRAKVGDLQGQLHRPDGSVEIQAMVCENDKSRHPFADEEECTARTDIFALGTLLYHVWHGHWPFPNLDQSAVEVQRRYRAGDFPLDVASAVGTDSIVCKCWTSKYDNVKQSLEDMAVYSSETEISST